MQELVRVSPMLRKLCDESIAFNRELLPHLLLGEVTELMQVSVGRDGTSDHLLSASELKGLLVALEAGMGSDDPHIVDLVRTSFLENLDQPRGNRPRAAYDAIKALMGPRLLEGLALFEELG